MPLGPMTTSAISTASGIAENPASPDAIFANSDQRGGDFTKYDALRLCYVGYGANHNKTTRFRRYKGTGGNRCWAKHGPS